MATSLAIQQEALTRAVSSQSVANHAAILRGFMAKGLSESEIRPRENVFSYNAWKALGRQVRKGEHGVKIMTVIVKRDARTGREEKRPWTVTVFHVSQTEPVGTDRVTVPYTPAQPAMPCYNGILYGNEPDATPENIPYAGEEETDESELLDHSATVHNGRPQLPANINGYPEVCSDCGRRRTCDDAGQCHECRQKDCDREREYEEQRERESQEPRKFSPKATVETFTIAPDGSVTSEPERPLYKKYCEKCGSGDLRHPADILCRNCRIAEPPEPPKDSAYDRAMRGETVNIMDMIDEFKREPAKLPARLQRATAPSYPYRRDPVTGLKSAVQSKQDVVF